MSLFKFPSNGWTLIEQRIAENPKMLNAGHYHTMSKDMEALTEEDILKPSTAHCVCGWVIAITPRAAAYERMREDVVEFANEILVSNGRLPIPWGIVFSEEESMRIFLKGRAADERQLAALAVN